MASYALQVKVQSTLHGYLRRNDITRVPLKLIVTTEVDQLMSLYKKLNHNFIQRSLKHDVKEQHSAPSPMLEDIVEEIKGQVDRESCKVPCVKSISDVCISLPDRVEKLPDRVIQYNRVDTLTKENMLGTKFQLDEDMSDCRSVYCK
ncbi:hypothetical protein EB796_014361 [Bugula neritina]|uniref:Uncharacterized protein n=1 Tax=Bugula neritina TaxID=10212 RepID=A0A7J7JNU4_BUGNE|nr:hypothetical protein EB796_014361 [Bugula neritina]